MVSSWPVTLPAALKGHGALLRGGSGRVGPAGLAEPSAPVAFPSSIPAFLPAQYHRLISGNKQNWKKGMTEILCLQSALPFFFFSYYVIETTGIFIVLLYPFQ